MLAHKGFAGFEIEVAGRAAHGSRPDLGIDAIVRAAPVLSRIGGLDEQLRGASAHPLLGTGSAHASVISGGQEYSSYPAWCRIVGERRPDCSLRASPTGAWPAAAGAPAGADASGPSGPP